MRSLRRALSTLLLLAPLSIALPAHAQNYTIASVVVTNTGPYTSAEVLAASGLEPGQYLFHDSLANAAQRLLNTGLFSDVGINLTGEGKARVVHVAPKPIPLDKLLPASFENFIWFTPDELTAGIHARVPLYRGVASDAGNLPDAIQSALQQMLTAKGITATLSHAIVEPDNLHPQLTVDFKVETPTILFGKATLAGIPGPLKAGMLSALQQLDGGPYNEGRTGVTVEDVLLAPARSAGYLNAKLQDVQRSPTPTAGGIAVTYAATFVSGDAFKVSTLTWNPTPLYSAADFARDAKLHPGDTASDSALAATEAVISTAYLAHGYLDIYILSHPTSDTTTHTVAYTLEPIPGEIYHLHTVTPTGLSSEALQEFNTAWQMKPGDVYNPTYAATFVKKNKALPHLSRYLGTFQSSADPQTHLVDLTMTFLPNKDNSD